MNENIKKTVITSVIFIAVCFAGYSYKSYLKQKAADEKVKLERLEALKKEGEFLAKLDVCVNDLMKRAEAEHKPISAQDAREICGKNPASSLLTQ